MYLTKCQICNKDLISKRGDKRFCGASREPHSCSYLHAKSVNRTTNRKFPRSNKSPEREIGDITADRNAFIYFNG